MSVRLLCFYFNTNHTATYLSDVNGNPYQFFLNLPFGESMAEQRTGAFENRYKFNDYGGKSFEKAFDEHTARSAELDEETGLYYYGARYYDPSISIFISVDPLTEQTMTPYQYTYQNPVRYIDPTGMAAEEVDDIRIRDKNGNLIATYYTTFYEEDIYLHNVDIKEEINLNINKATKNLPDVDVIGISIGGEFTVGGGANADWQYAFFLDGKDAGNGAFYYTVQGTLGLSIGGGVSAFAGDYTGAKGDSLMSMNDFLGNITSYNAGGKFISGSFWWGNNLNSSQPELWPGMGDIYNKPGFEYETTWRGFSIGGVLVGTPKLEVGASYAHGVSEYLQWANRLFNLRPHTQKYQYQQ